MDTTQQFYSITLFYLFCENGLFVISHVSSSLSLSAFSWSFLLIGWDLTHAFLTFFYFCSLIAGVLFRALLDCCDFDSSLKSYFYSPSSLLFL
jgi:hypothetical protein